MTKRLAIIGSVLAGIIFVTTLARPAGDSEWPPLVQATAGATGAFLTVWLIIPLFAYVAYLVLTPLRRTFRKSSGPDA